MADKPKKGAPATGETKTSTAAVAAPVKKAATALKAASKAASKVASKAASTVTPKAAAAGPQGAAGEKVNAVPAGAAVQTPAAAAGKGPKPVEVTPEQRYRMIQDAAYFIAEREGFGGDNHRHWLEAEAAIDAELRPH